MRTSTSFPISARHPRVLATLLLGVLFTLTAIPEASGITISSGGYHPNPIYLSHTISPTGNAIITGRRDYLDWDYQPSFTGNAVIPTTVYRGYYYYNSSGYYSVEGIESGAFSGCTDITSVTIPNCVTYIGVGAFRGCTGLTHFIIDASNSQYSCVDGVLFNKNQTTLIAYPAGKQGEYTIPSSVTRIENEAFSGCVSLTNMTIPNTLTDIGRDAFNGCTNLKNFIVDPSHPTYSSIDGVVFDKTQTTLLLYPCGKQGVYTVPNRVTSFREYAFSGCTLLMGFAVEADNPNFIVVDGVLFNKNQTTLVAWPEGKQQYYTIPNSVTRIENGAFSGCANLSSVVMPNGITSIGKHAFDGCAILTEITLPRYDLTIGDDAFANCATLTIMINGVKFNADRTVLLWYPREKQGEYMIPQGVTSISNSAFSDCTGLTNVTIPGTVSIVDGGAFRGCTGLTSITIPASVTEFGGSAFAGCTGITNVTIPGTVSFIGGGAFKGCSGLTSVTILEDVTGIGEEAFADCTTLAKITIPSSVNFLGGSAFAQCAQLTSVVIPDGVVQVNEYAFADCARLTSVTLGSNVATIGACAFWGCFNLANITLPHSVTQIGYGAFHGCASLTHVTISDHVTSIGDSAFYGCAKLADVVIPGSVGIIGTEVFSGCTGLTSVVIGDGVSKIGDDAFSNCDHLSSVTTPGSLRSIGVQAFYHCDNLTKLTLVDGVVAIGNCAFDYCDLLTSVTIPASVHYIEYGAFAAQGLKEIFFYGDAPQVQWYHSVCGNLTAVTAYYIAGRSGFSELTWNGYPCATFTQPVLSENHGGATGQTSVVITGMAFTGVTAVMFGSVPATSFTVDSTTQITATVPAGVPGRTVNVTVVTPSGTSHANAQSQYTYLFSGTEPDAFYTAQVTDKQTIQVDIGEFLPPGTICTASVPMSADGIIRGTVTCNGSVLTYTADWPRIPRDITGPVTWKIQAESIANGTVKIGTVMVNVTGVNDAPVAQDATFSSGPNAPGKSLNWGEMRLHGSDIDIGDRIVSYTIDSLPDAAMGILFANTGIGPVVVGQRFTAAPIMCFVPYDNQRGTTSFTFHVTDSYGLDSAPATVQVAIGDTPWYPYCDWEWSGNWAHGHNVQILDANSQVLLETNVYGNFMDPQPYFRAGCEGLLPGNYTCRVRTWDLATDKKGDEILIDKPFTVPDYGEAKAAISLTVTAGENPGEYTLGFIVPNARGYEAMVSGPNGWTAKFRNVFRPDPVTGLMPLDQLVTLGVRLPATGTYSWKVRGFNPLDEAAGLDDVSPAWTDGPVIVVQNPAANGPLNAPDGMFPKDGDVINAPTGVITLTLQWNPVPGATSYLVYLASSGAAPVLPFKNVGNITSMRIPLNTGNYSWSVMAINAEGNPSPAGIASFDVMQSIAVPVIQSVTVSGDGTRLTLAHMNGSALATAVDIQHFNSVTRKWEAFVGLAVDNNVVMLPAGVTFKSSEYIAIRAIVPSHPPANFKPMILQKAFL